MSESYSHKQPQQGVKDGRKLPIKARGSRDAKKRAKKPNSDKGKEGKKVSGTPSKLKVPRSSKLKKLIGGQDPRPIIERIILQFPSKRAKLNQVSTGFIRFFPILANHNGWRGSVRYNLTCTAYFINNGETGTNIDGDGGYWSVDDTLKGTKRPRYRKVKSPPGGTQPTASSAPPDDAPLSLPAFHAIFAPVAAGWVASKPFVVKNKRIPPAPLLLPPYNAQGAFPSPPRDRSDSSSSAQRLIEQLRAFDDSSETRSHTTPGSARTIGPRGPQYTPLGRNSARNAVPPRKPQMKSPIRGAGSPWENHHHDRAGYLKFPQGQQQNGRGPHNGAAQMDVHGNRVTFL